MFTPNDPLILWLLDSDVAIQYQTSRDLLNNNKPQLAKRIEKEGWGNKLLSLRNVNGHWGKGFYQPKWTSTHYTLLDLKNLNLLPGNKSINQTLNLIFEKEKGPDGGIKPIGTNGKSDVCINGMVLNYASYFGVKEEDLRSVIDFLLNELMKDGGFNCQSNRKGAVHSSLHTTLSVLEGVHEYTKSGYTYRLKELINARQSSIEFILIHKLFRSDKTNTIINQKFLSFPYPSRWYYDILRTMDHFQNAKVKYDPRMDEAVTVILKKRMKDGTWKLAAKYPGQTHFEMEKVAMPSRWNTLRALRVLNYYHVL